MLFENGYHARTGLVSSRNTTAQNTWRNNFNLQKGLGCYAPPNDLASQTFLNQDRAACPHLAQVTPGVFSGSSCQLCTTGATYRNERHRKWLRIDPGGSGYAVVDLLNVPNFIPYVAPGGTRIPLLPLVVAMYRDALPGLVTGARRQVDTQDFATDFNFSLPELQAYFDDDPANAHNRRLMQAHPTITTFTRLTAFVGPIPHQPAPAAPQARPHPGPGRPGRDPCCPLPPSTPGGPPRTTCSRPSLRRVGPSITCRGSGSATTLYARQRRHVRYVDVKSSLGYCTVTMTAREWQQAQFHGASYVLAIIENFNPSAQNTIYWVPDPSNTCSHRAAQTVTYSVARTSWSAHTVPIANI